MSHSVKVPHFPAYAPLRAVLPVWVGLSASRITGLRGTISRLTGSPQANADWSRPDAWIPARLTGDDQALAQRIWTDSGNTVNPRHMLGHWLLSRNYGLLSEDGAGRLQLTDAGRDFIRHPAGETVRKLDEAEGLLALLRIVAEDGPAVSTAFGERWRAYLQQVSQIRSENAARSRQYYRFRNLLARGFIARQGRRLAVTDAGLAWLRGARQPDADEPDLYALARARQKVVREAMREHLHQMDPIAFEHLIKRLLEAMGYTDVEVTAPANDGGVDVVGDVEVGISAVREVIQVKRYRKNIRRPTLDALRGSLHRFKAFRGTIITTSGFTKGTRDAAFELGAAPITLIDGEKLVELLIDHDIGVRRKRIEVWELDMEAFAAGEE